MRRLALAFCLAAALTGTSRADDGAEANKLFVQAFRAWEKVGTLPADAPERADLVRLVAGNLHRIVDEYPGADLAVKLLIGETVGPLSLATADAALAALPAADGGCVSDGCVAALLLKVADEVTEAPPGRMRADMVTAAARLMARSGQVDQAFELAAAQGGPNGRDEALRSIAMGAADRQDDAVVEKALAGMKDRYSRDRALVTLTLLTAGQGDTRRAMAYLDRLSPDAMMLGQSRLAVIDALLAAGDPAAAEKLAGQYERADWKDAVAEVMAVAGIAARLESDDSEAALAAALAEVEAMKTQFGRHRGFLTLAKAQAMAGQLEAAQKTARRFEVLKGSEGTLAVAEVLALVFRFDEARVVIDSLPKADRAARRLRIEAILDGRDAVLARIGAAPVTEDLVRDVMGWLMETEYPGDAQYLMPVAAAGLALAQRIEDPERRLRTFAYVARALGQYGAL